MKLRRLSLSTVTAMTIAAMISLTMFIAYFSFFWIMKQVTEVRLLELPADAAQAYRDIQAGVTPPFESFQKLMLLMPA